MLTKVPGRKSGSARHIAALALAASVAAPVPAGAGGLWDSVMEKMDLKASPAAPGPDFVERTRPDPAGLGYMPTALPHKVSPVPVKGADEIEAKKAALDAAAQRQHDPAGPAKPLDLAKGRKAGKAKAAAAVAD